MLHCTASNEACRIRWNFARSMTHLDLRSDYARAFVLLLRLAQTPEVDVLLVGGGGLMIFPYFMVLSGPALDLLADEGFMAACRGRLLACGPKDAPGKDAGGGGRPCRFKTTAKDGALSVCGNAR